MYREKIREYYDHLSRSYRKVADYIMSNYYEVSFMTAAQLAYAVGVDTTTVVRFSQRLGYNGYPELLQDIREQVKAEIYAAYEPQALTPDDPAGVFKDRTIQEQENLQQVLVHNPPEHIEATLDKLRRAGVEVELAPPRIPYLETIRGRAKNVEGKHKKQTGGKGQFGVCFLDVEPAPRGTGLIFEDAIVGGAIPRQFIPSVEKGIKERMHRGGLAGYPITDVKVRVFDGKYHDVDSDSRSFEMAGSKGFLAAFKQAQPVLLEPYMKIEVSIPEDYMGTVIGDLNNRRAHIGGMEAKGKVQMIMAQIPMSETLDYSAFLRSATGGRGNFGLAMSHYAEMPQQLADKVIASAKKHVEEDEE